MHINDYRTGPNLLTCLIDLAKYTLLYGFAPLHHLHPYLAHRFSPCLLTTS